MEEHEIAMNKSLLGDAPKLFGDDYATLYCVTLPICIPVKQLQGYSDDYQGFSQFLDEKQGLGAFYSCPIFYTLFIIDVPSGNRSVLSSFPLDEIVIAMTEPTIALNK